MQKKLVIAISIVIVIAIAVGAFFYTSHKNKVRKATLITAFSEIPETLNPVFEQNPAGLALLDTVFDGLTNKSGKRVNDFRLAIATDFIQDSKNKNVFYVELDTDIKWHDYSEENKHYVTSEDIVFTYKCIVNEANKSPLRPRISKLIKDIEVIAEDEVKVTFREAVSPNKVSWLLPFKIIPATYYGKPMSVHLRTDEVAKEFSKNPIGTGPYKLETWLGNTITLSLQNQENEMAEDEAETSVANSLTTIETRLIHDTDKQAKMLIDGKIDLLLKTNSDLQEKLNAENIKHEEYIPRHFYALAFNTKSETFKDRKIRQAVSMAIDKKKVAELVWKGDVSEYINYGTFPHNDDKRYKKLKNFLPYNIKKAERLLDSYGEIQATLIYSESESGAMKRMAGKIAAQLSEVGIKLEVRALGMAFDSQIDQGNFDIALIKHDNFTDGYDIAKLYKTDSPENITGVKSKELDKILTKWENTAFWSERLPLAVTAHKMISDISPYTYLFSLPTSAYYSARLKNVSITDPTALMATVEDWEVAE